MKPASRSLDPRALSRLTQADTAATSRSHPLARPLALPRTPLHFAPVASIEDAEALAKAPGTIAFPVKGGWLDGAKLEVFRTPDRRLLTKTSSLFAGTSWCVATGESPGAVHVTTAKRLLRPRGGAHGTYDLETGAPALKAGVPHLVIARDHALYLHRVEVDGERDGLLVKLELTKIPRPRLVRSPAVTTQAQPQATRPPTARATSPGPA